MAVLGAVLGLVGSVSTKVFGIFEKREERKTLEVQNAHEVNRWAFEKEMFTLQSQAKVAETEQEAFLMTVQGSYEGLEQSIRDQQELSKRAPKWVISILALMRPSLTLTFTGIVGYMAIVGSDGDLKKAALIACVDMASLCVTWWFGDRSAKRIVEMRGTHIRAAGGEF